MEIIDGCTEWDSLPKPPWQERKNRYLENLRHASASVRRVSLADKLHNARSLLIDSRIYGDIVWSHLKIGREKTLWFYKSLLEVYRETGDDWMTNEFARIVSQLAEE
ncbi:metal dependent phosphohydrolase [Calothrix brevissima NIES-22]|nr:metal dependent phosphohydrolase [Calothrix brevissima NIES-22]